MKNVIIAFAWIALCHNNLLIAQTTSKQLAETLVRFEQQYLNCSFRFEVEEVYVHGPAWSDGTIISQKKGLCRRSAESGMWVEVINSQQNDYFASAYEIPAGLAVEDIPDRIKRMSAQIVSANSSVNVSGSQEGSGGETYHVSGTIKSNEGRAKWSQVGNHVFCDDLNFLFGFELYLANYPTKFSDILSEQQVKPEKRQLDGEPCSFVFLKVPEGDIKVWFGSSPIVSPLKIEIDRTSAHNISDSFKVRDIGGYCMGDDPTLIRLNHKFTDLQFVEVDGKRCCSGFTFEKREEFADGQQSLCIRKVRISDIKLNSGTIKSHSVDFELFTIPDNTRFGAEDAANIPYMIVGGKINKVVNEKTLESLDGVRFDMPRGQSWSTIILAMCVIAVFAGFFLYKKRQSFQ